MATTKSVTPTPTTFLDPTRTIDALSAWAQANERVIGQFVELSAGAALQALRTYGELQAATIESVRGARTPGAPAEGATQGPLDWYNRGLMGAVEGSERFVKLMETQAQIVARGNQRFQDAAERAGKDIRGAVETYVERMKEIYSAN
jgi:hypothetical protein